MHSDIIQTFLLRHGDGKPIKKTCFRIKQPRRRIVFVSASQGLCLMNSHFISCTMMFIKFKSNMQHRHASELLVDKSHEFLFEHLFVVFVSSIKQLRGKPRSTHKDSTPKNATKVAVSTLPWTRRK